MMVAPEISIESRREQLVVHSNKGWSTLWHRLGLAIVMLISNFMNFYQLG